MGEIQGGGGGGGDGATIESEESGPTRCGKNTTAAG